MRRHLMKASGEKLPAWFREHIICWYSPKRQRATNESLAADPRLIDLSGKGHHGNIIIDTSIDNSVDCNPDGSIQFMNSSYVSCVKGSSINDFTIIADRELSVQSIGRYPCVAGMCGSGGAGLFQFEQYGTNGVSSFGEATNVVIDRSKKISFMTPTRYNETTILKGTNVYQPILEINRSGTSSTIAAVRLYNFFLFDITLADEQIDWVKTNLIDK